jgi:hypothetical protein
MDTSSGLKVKDLKIPRRTFVMLVLKWCTANLGTNSYPFNLQIYYHRNLKWGGRYKHWNRLIIVYVYEDLLLLDLVDSVVHEYIHYLQFAKKNTERDYNESFNELGYWQNTFEVEARKQAGKFKDSCFEWVSQQMEKSIKLNVS